MEEKAKKADWGNLEEKADRENLEEEEKTGKRQLLGVKAKMHKLEEKKMHKLEEKANMHKLEEKGANQRQADETKADQQ